MRTLLTLFMILLIQLNAVSQPVPIVRGLQFTEGPAIDKQGNLYFSDVKAQQIYVYTRNKGHHLFLDNTGGANGLYFDKQGNLIACAGKARKLVLITPSREIKTLVDSYGGKKLNSPNDLWIDPKGGIYFTDPRYGNANDLEQDGMHVYFFIPRDSNLIRVTKDLVRPNGIVGSPDGKLLYVVDQGAQKTYRYQILPDRSLTGKVLFANVGTDGMTIDSKGNIYITHQKTVQCFAPDQKLLNTITFDAMTTNVVFYKKQLFVTTQAGEVFQINLN